MFVRDSLWAIVVVLGFVILGGAMLYARTRNKVSPQQEARTEAATRELYKQQSAEDRTRTP